MADQSMIDRLTRYVAPEARNLSIPDASFIGECVDEATALVSRVAADAVNPVPVEIIDRAVIEVGSELFHRRAAPNGISQFAALDGQPVRVARDPMNAARAILAPFLPLGFA